MKLKNQSVVVAHCPPHKTQNALGNVREPVIQNTQSVVNAPRQIADPYHCFTSGAWLFDDSQAPLWLLEQVTTKQGRSRPENLRDFYKFNKKNTSKVQCVPLRTATPICPPDHAITSGAWLFDLSDVPDWFRNALASETQSGSTGQLNNIKRVYQKAANTRTQDVGSRMRPLPPVPNSNMRSASACTSSGNNHSVSKSQDLFETGGWLFDSEMAPSWFKSQVTDNKSRARNQNSIQSKCPVQAVYDDSQWRWANPQQQWVRGQKWSMKENCQNPRNQVTCDSQKQMKNHFTVPIKGQASNGLGKYSLVQSDLCAPVECPRSIRVQDYIDDGCSKNDMYAGVMRPNKTYLGRSKESKMGAKSKYSKPYY